MIGYCIQIHGSSGGGDGDSGEEVADEVTIETTTNKVRATVDDD